MRYDGGPRTTIVSFVVHRIGDRWLCASVHHTDVTPTTETTVIDEAGAPGWGELSERPGILTVSHLKTPASAYPHYPRPR